MCIYCPLTDLNVKKFSGINHKLTDYINIFSSSNILNLLGYCEIYDPLINLQLDYKTIVYRSIDSFSFEKVKSQRKFSRKT